MHGGVKFYRGSATAARCYVEADRSRADDYYLAEGTGVAAHLIAHHTPETVGQEGGVLSVSRSGELDGPIYELWVAGYDVTTGAAKGRLRTDDRGLRFVEVVVNGPKTWSLAATLHPDLAAAYDAAQDRAATEIIGWLAQHATTRIGPRGRQVQVPVEQLEAAVVRHYTSRAGDPHRHLHLQVNARVFARNAWRGLHSVGVVDSIEAINGIGHAAIMCDPEFRQALAEHGYRLDPDTGEVTALAPYIGAFSARASQITGNTDRYEAEWRRDHPGEEPGPRLRRVWDRRAWAQARPDKVVPTDGAELARRWAEELNDLGFRAPTGAVHPAGTSIGRVDRTLVADTVLVRLGSRRSAWNVADIWGEVERIVAGFDIVAPPAVRGELTEDLTNRTLERCVRLLDGDDVPEHVRALTSHGVLDIEDDLVDRLAHRAHLSLGPAYVARLLAGTELDDTQRRVVATLAGRSRLVVVEGVAGAGKTTTLAEAHRIIEMYRQRMVVVTPTLKAARVAGAQVGADSYSAAWLVHQHGFRWDDDGRWTRVEAQPEASARLRPDDLLVVDEAGMLDQDTARALVSIADEADARLAFVGDPHQLPAVGRGGVLDLAARWASVESCFLLEGVHRFADAEYAELSLLMRNADDAEQVFDTLLRRGELVVHPTEVERLAALSSADGLVIADTHEQVRALNAAIRDRRLTDAPTATVVTTESGEQLSAGDTVATRENNRDLDVANRDTWTVLAIADNGEILVEGERGRRTLPRAYVRHHVELAYATTAYGAQGQTVETAHLLVDESTGAATTYVGMTRGRHRNVAHLVAESIDDARAQWVRTFSRDRADLGPRHAADRARAEIESYGPAVRPQEVRLRTLAPVPRRAREREPGVSR